MTKITLFALAPVGCLTLGLATNAAAQGNPFLGANHFPQFRQLSGLSGGGYGVDWDGGNSLGGATAFSTPLGFTLGRDQVRMGAGDTFFNSHDLSIRFSNTTGDASGKAFFTYGHTFGNFAVTYSYFVKSSLGDESTNLQFAYVPRSDREPGFSVGVQDIAGNGGSAGQDVPGDNETSRSIFGAATYGLRIESIPNPIYVTAGIGTRRFSGGFASASYWLWGPLRLWSEYDGFGINEGILVTLRKGTKSDPSAFETDLMVGVIQGHYLTAAVTFGF